MQDFAEPAVKLLPHLAVLVVKPAPHCSVQVVVKLVEEFEGLVVAVLFELTATVVVIGSVNKYEQVI